MPQLFMSPDGFPKEGQPLFWSTRPHPPNRAREPRRLSVPLGEDRRRRNKKFPRPRQSFAAYPAQLGSDGRSGSREGSESGLSARRRPMGDGRPKIFISHLCSSVSRSASSDIVHPLCRCARAGAVLCGNFAPFCNRVSGGKRRPLPSPLQMLEQSGNSWGNFASLARSIPFASRMASAQYVRSHPIPSDLQLRSFRSDGLSLSLSLAGYELFLWGQYLCMEMCTARERKRGQWGAIVLQNEEAPAQTNGESQDSGRIRWSRNGKERDSKGGCRCLSQGTSNSK